MDGKRIQEYWSTEVDALVQTYRQFETLIPAPTGAGAQHKGEDGRFVEDLLREYLSRFLPKDLEVLAGFILRPAVKTGEKGTNERPIGTNTQRNWTLSSLIQAYIPCSNALVVV